MKPAAKPSLTYGPEVQSAAPERRAGFFTYNQKGG